MIADQFRALVDQSIRSMTLADRDSIFQFYQVNGAAHLDQVSFGNRICAALQGPQVPARWGLLRSLKDTLSYQAEVFDLPREPYEDILRVIFNTVRGECALLDEHDRWLNAIAAARAQIALFGPPFHGPDPRWSAVNKAIRILRADGYRFTVLDRGLAFKDGEIERLTAAIDADVRAIGGVDVIGQVFRHLEAKGNFDGVRYTVARRYVPLTAERDPSFPVGYLVNLAARHVAVKPTAGRSAQDIWRRLCTRVVALCAAYDVEPYVSFADMILFGAQDIGRFLSTNALYDHIFMFRQWSPSHTADLLRQIFALVDQDWMATHLGWTLEEALRLTEIVLRREQPYAGAPALFSSAHLKWPGVRRETWQRMLPAFVHRLGQVNNSCRLPNDVDLNLFNKPLMKVSKDQFLALPPSLAGPAFYEAVSNALRSAAYPKLDTILGDALEQVLIPGEARRRGYAVRVVGGKYRMLDPTIGKRVDGECDVIIETDDLVLFVEAKKKVLTRPAWSGDALANLCDLSDSLLRGQAQAARHERLLRHHGHLLFADGTRLDLNNRHIDRMVVTLLDYGSSQDRNIMSQVYQALAGVTITAAGDVSAGKKRALVELNKRCQELVHEANALEKLGVAQRSQRFNLWFVSAATLLELLDHAGAPAHLSSYLRKLKHTTFASGDPYCELVRREQLERQVAAETAQQAEAEETAGLN